MIYAAPDETLEDHVRVALEFLYGDRLSLAKCSKALARASKINLGIGVNEEEARDVINLAIALHDIGKAYAEYQQMILKAKSSKDFSVPRHEVYSAFAINKLLDKRVNELWECMILSVLWHHYPTRGENIAVIFRTMREYLRIGKVTISREAVEEVRSIVEASLEGVGVRVDRYNLQWNAFPREVELGDGELFDFLNGLNDKFALPHPERIYATALSILYPLQLCDIYSASKNRGLKSWGEFPMYLEELPSYMFRENLRVLLT